MPENGILVNPVDVGRLGLRDGLEVKVVSATNPTGEWQLGDGDPKRMVCKIVATQRTRPGVVSFALGFGHWATGASDITIDGTVIKGEERRRAGIHANAAMWTDPTITNTCIFDPVGECELLRHPHPLGARLTGAWAVGPTARAQRGRSATPMRASRSRTRASTSSTISRTVARSSPWGSLTAQSS
jgi:hypothetical protein